MANMSYCRFRNTLEDLLDCYNALDDEGIDDLSHEEKRAALKLIQTCVELAEEFKELAE